MIKVNVGPAGMVGWDGGNCIGIWVGADTYLYIYIYIYTCTCILNGTYDIGASLYCVWIHFRYMYTELATF